MAAEALAKKKEKNITHTGRPTHTHACGHECDSPYCGESPVDEDCHNCGGPAYIAKGLEPWRGRQ